MGLKSAIEWTDASWNPVTGCTKVSPGCKFCYAERITERRGQDFTNVVLHPNRLDYLSHWKKPRRIFVNSMSDLFHEEIPDEFIERVFESMLEVPQHIYQILTKRPERMRTWITQWLAPALTEKMLENIWLGVSCENQQYANERIPLLLQTPAAVRFVSLEPLLGPIRLKWQSGTYFRFNAGLPDGSMSTGLDWAVVGGESGGPPERALVKAERVASFSGPFVGARTAWRPKAKALEWVLSIRDQCVASDVPFFFKQWGGPTPKSGGRLLDGREWNEMPGRNPHAS